MEAVTEQPAQEPQKSLANGNAAKKVKRHRKKKVKQQQKKDPKAAITDERLKAFGINPKRYRNKLKYKKE